MCIRDSFGTVPVHRSQKYLTGPETDGLLRPLHNVPSRRLPPSVDIRLPAQRIRRYLLGINGTTMHCEPKRRAQDVRMVGSSRAAEFKETLSAQALNTASSPSSSLIPLPL